MPEIPLLPPFDAFAVTLVMLAQEVAADRPYIERLLANPFLLPVGLLVVFSLTYLLPERRRKAEEARRLAAIQKNDRVVTVGGIHGVVVAASVDSDVITLKIDEGGNTRVKFNRSAIATVVNATADKSAKGKPSAGNPPDSST